MKQEDDSREGVAHIEKNGLWQVARETHKWLTARLAT